MGAGAFDPDVINGVEYVPLPQVEQAIQAAVAEKDARIKELEGIASGRTMFDAPTAFGLCWGPATRRNSKWFPR